MPAKKSPKKVTLDGLRWPFPAEYPAEYANQFLIAKSHDGMYVLEVGQLSISTAINRDPAEVESVLADEPIISLGRYFMTPEMVRLIRDMLSTRLEADAVGEPVARRD